MERYSDLIEQLLRHDDLFKVIHPREPISHALLGRIRDCDPVALAAGKPVKAPATFALLRGALFYAIDAIDEAHQIFQNDSSDLAAYWHGMVHRREADFDNARYWFRRAGTLPSFAKMHAAAREHSSDMARQNNWDPFLLTTRCEHARFGEEGSKQELSALHRVEFEVLLDYCWRHSLIL